MLTHEIKQLDDAFKTLVKRRRGTLIQRAGAGSRDFEMSFEFRGLEVLFGIESGWIADDAMFLFVRHAKSALVREHVNPFFPTEAPPRDLKEDVPASGPRIPGFSVRVRPLELREKLVRLLTRKTVYSDPHRPGWFHMDLEPGDRVTALPEGLRAPMESLMSAGPRITKLSVAMTSLFFRIRRVPFPLEVSAIEDFVTDALTLFHAALDAPPEVPVDVPGLELFEVLLDRNTGARCGVCGEEATARRVQCARCDTPHHGECWKYGGGCSVYACGSRENVECV